MLMTMALALLTFSSKKSKNVFLKYRSKVWSETRAPKKARLNKLHPLSQMLK